MNATTVLIADDATDIRTVVKYALLDQGFHVIEAADGYETIRLARQCRPALILLDLCMPGLDGWEVATCLRSDPALEDVPIIAMTAYDLSSAIRAARAVGCQQVVAKPFHLYEFMSLVAGMLSPTASLSPYYA